jgi:hypothetical protein
MGKLSVRHHYLPRHYLTGFTGERGGFYVYDKQNDRVFLSDPDSTFFGKHLNTVVFKDGSRSDFVEGLYAHAEKLAWPALRRIRESTYTTPIDPLDKMNLLLFLLTLHWRLPRNLGVVDKLADLAFRDNDGTFGYFSLIDNTGQKVPEPVTEAIRSSSAFRKSMRLLAPLAPFFSDQEWTMKLENWRFLYAADGQPWYLVGDSPIITEGEADQDPINCLNEFVFPVSGSILLVSKQTPISHGFPPEFVIQVNAALIERAERFVAGWRKDVLEAMVDDWKLHSAAKPQPKSEAFLPS